MVLTSAAVRKVPSMKTYPIKDDKGQLFALEVDMVYCGLRNLIAVIASAEGVTDAKISSAQAGGGDTRATFRYLGDNFAVTEPFGDNSRYWVGPVDKSARRNIEAIDERLREFQPSTLRRIFGGLITLDFAAIMRR